jgi:2-polyprenyl-3-methyl-5-hydroxy-6-metoxy-1,4-benzoquinol methylase
MSVTRYTARIDLLDTNDSHALGILCVPPNSDVLDVGAADGSVAAVLGHFGCRVWGVELDAAAAEAAREHCEQVIVADIEELDLRGAFGEQRFDVVLLLDVLEHLKAPGETLRRLPEILNPGGRVVASIPNVTHAAVRAQLLHGRFVYTDLGLLDRTHLRFFDRRGVRELFREAGFAIHDELRVTRPLEGTEIPVDPDSLPEGFDDAVSSDPDADTYQFVVVAAPEDAGGEPPLVLPLAELLQRRIRKLEETLAAREREVRELYAEFQERGRYIDELAGRVRGLDEIARTVGELRADAEARRAMLVEILTHALENGRDVRAACRSILGIPAP